MSAYEFIDTFPSFLKYWEKAQHKSLDEQIAGWATGYIARWPELLAKQRDNYSAEKIDWQQIAREKVFPYLPQRLPVMKEAHQNLLKICAPLYSKAQRVLDFESDVVFVIYVGIGCGAGWVTPFHNSPAILFGLENIAECGWSNPEGITGLATHEIGHLVHQHWRAQHGKSISSGAWWQLYEEGFAQRCESLIFGTDAWHQTSGIMAGDWLGWCQSHKSWLAAEFLKTVETGQSVAQFFGSWFEIDGKSEAGYFLGNEVIRVLERQFSLKEIALLDDTEAYTRPILKQMIEHSP